MRSLQVVDDGSVSPNGPVYYEPLPLHPVSNHKTLEIETVKLAQDIDPRKLVTELRLNRPPAFAPVSDSGWPPETALSSSQPPKGPTRRWRTPAVLLTLLAALLVLVLARAVSRRSTVGTVSAANGALSVTAPASLPASVPAVPSPAAVSVASAPEAAALPIASVTEPAAITSVVAPVEAARVVPESQHSTKKNMQPSAPSQSLAAPSSSKPKRAIY
jgi:hypothetical protein